jgi:MFS family permease
MLRTSFGSSILVLILWLAGLGAAAQFAKFAVPFGAVRLLYPDAGTEIGWLLTLISALGAVLGMTAGVLVSRIGLGRTVMIALLLGGGISLWQATLPGLPIMFASRVIEGISHLMIVVAAPTLIAQVTSDRYRGLGMTLWSTFFGVSFALTAWFGLPFVEHRGLDGLLMAHGVYMLLIAVVLGIALPIIRGAKAKATAIHNRTPIIKQHIDAYRSPYVAAPAIGWLFYTMTFVALLAVLPELLPPSSRATIVGFMPIVSIAVSLIIVSAMLTKMTAVAITMVGFVLSSLVVMFFFIGLPLPYICIGLFATLGLIQGASFASVPELNTSYEGRALANGAMAQMGNLGNLVGTPILLSVLGYGGHAVMFLTVVVLYLLGALAHLSMAHARG